MWETGHKPNILTGKCDGNMQKKRDGLGYSAFLFASPFTVLESNKNLQNKNGLIRYHFDCKCCT